MITADEAWGLVPTNSGAPTAQQGRGRCPAAAGAFGGLGRDQHTAQHSAHWHALNHWLNGPLEQRRGWALPHSTQEPSQCPSLIVRKSKP